MFKLPPSCSNFLPELTNFFNRNCQILSLTFNFAWYWSTFGPELADILFGNGQFYSLMSKFCLLLINFLASNGIFFNRKWLIFQMNVQIGPIWSIFCPELSDFFIWIYPFSSLTSKCYVIFVDCFTGIGIFFEQKCLNFRLMSKFIPDLLNFWPELAYLFTRNCQFLSLSFKFFWYWSIFGPKLIDIVERIN